MLTTSTAAHPSTSSRRCSITARSFSEELPFSLSAAKPLTTNPNMARISIPPALGSPGMEKRCTAAMMTKTDPTRRMIEISSAPSREKRL